MVETNTKLNGWINTSYTCMKPFWFAQEHIIRCILPLKPGQYGQCESKTMEVFRRVMVMIVATPLCLLGIPLYLVGHCSLMIARAFAKIDYQHFYNASLQKPSVDKIKLLSLNACMMSGGLPLVFGGMLPMRYRLERLTNMIKEQSPDIVFLSEIDPCEAPKLKAQLEKKYAHIFMRIGMRSFGQEAGFFLAINQKIEGIPQFIDFNAKSIGFQRTIRKGFIPCELEKCILVFTHLEPGESKKSSEVREKQLLEIKDHMQKQTKPCVLAGDLNIDWLNQHEEYKQLIEENGFIPIGITPEKSNYTANTKYEPFAKHQKEYVDYFVALKNIEATGKILTSITLEPPISDHAAIEAELNFQKA